MRHDSGCIYMVSTRQNSRTNSAESGVAEGEYDKWRIMGMGFRRRAIKAMNEIFKVYKQFHIIVV